MSKDASMGDRSTLVKYLRDMGHSNERVEHEPDSQVNNIFEYLIANSQDGRRLYTGLQSLLKLQILKTAVATLRPVNSLSRGLRNLFDTYPTPQQSEALVEIGKNEAEKGFFYSPKGVHSQKFIFNQNIDWHSGTRHPEFDPNPNNRKRTLRMNKAMKKIHQTGRQISEIFSPTKESFFQNELIEKGVKSFPEQHLQPLFTKIIDESVMFQSNKTPDIHVSTDKKTGEKDIVYGKLENYPINSCVRLVFRNEITDAHSEPVYRYADLTLEQYHNLIHGEKSKKIPFSISHTLTNGMNQEIQAHFTKHGIKVSELDDWFENEAQPTVLGAKPIDQTYPHPLESIKDPRVAISCLTYFSTNKDGIYKPESIDLNSGHAQATGSPVKSFMDRVILPITKIKGEKVESHYMLDTSTEAEFTITPVFDSTIAKRSPNLAEQLKQLYLNSFSNKGARDLAEILNVAETLIQIKTPEAFIKLISNNKKMHKWLYDHGSPHFTPESTSQVTDFYVKAIEAVTHKPSYLSTEPDTLEPGNTNALQMAVYCNGHIKDILDIVDQTIGALTHKEVSQNGQIVDSKTMGTDIIFSSNDKNELILKPSFVNLLISNIGFAEEKARAKNNQSAASFLALAVGALRDSVEKSSNSLAETLMMQLMASGHESNLGTLSSEMQQRVSQWLFKTALSRTTIYGISQSGTEFAARNQPDDPLAIWEIVNQTNDAHLIDGMIAQARSKFSDISELDYHDQLALLWLQNKSLEITMKDPSTTASYQAKLERYEIESAQSFKSWNNQEKYQLDQSISDIIRHYDELGRLPENLRELEKDDYKNFNQSIAKYAELSGISIDQAYTQLKARIKQCSSVNLHTPQDIIYKQILHDDAQLTSNEIENIKTHNKERAEDVNLTGLYMNGYAFTSLDTAIEQASYSADLYSDLSMIGDRITSTLAQFLSNNPKNKKYVHEINQQQSAWHSHKSLSVLVYAVTQAIGSHAHYLHQVVSTSYKLSPNISLDTIEQTNPDNINMLLDQNPILTKLDYDDPENIQLLCNEAQHQEISASCVTNYLYKLSLEKTGLKDWLVGFVDPTTGKLAQLKDLKN